MTACRFCATPLDLTLVDLGMQPPSNAYLPRPDAPEKVFPLKAMVCRTCRLVQLSEAVPPDAIFHADYAYFSSYSDSWVAHARAYAEAMTGRFGLDAGSKVVEVASNDGYLLQHFVQADIPVLGVDPAAGCAEAARAKGVETEVAFFNTETATRLRDAGHAADLIAANNVLAHVPDIRGFVSGFPILLKPDGVLTVEFPHLLSLLDGTQFDTIYHEHYFYLSLLAVEAVFAACGLRVFDVEEIPTHGGSLRVFACRAESDAHPDGPGLARVRDREAAASLGTDAAYAGFEAKCGAVRDGLRSFLAEARARGETVVGYGAAAKGNTLLNYAGIGADDIRFVCDRNPAKQGCYLPGSHVAVRSPEALAAARPDYVLILPWNIRDEVAAQLAEIRNWGGRFAVAVPEMKLW